jgi:GT2 family glycosyltransferase
MYRPRAGTRWQPSFAATSARKRLVAPTRSLPETSLIVCSRNRPDLLVETVSGILQGDEVPSELIIIDQSDERNSTLEVLRTGKPCDIRYCWSGTVGLSRANNEGVRLARHDCLVFTHDDVRVTATWFGVLVRALVGAGASTIVTGKVVPETSPDAGGFVPSTKVDESPRVYEGRIAEGVLYPMTMAMYRSVLEDVGVFDERLGPGTPYPAAEDNDLCHRLLESGYRIMYVPDAVLFHRAWRPDRDFLPLRWSYGRGQGAFYAKHSSLRDRFILRQMGWEMQHRGRRLLRRLPVNPRVAFGELVYLSGIMSGFGGWLLRHRTRADA